MSLKRLNEEERAVYLLGEAVMRQLKGAPRDPETRREIGAVARWITHWLTDEEYAHVVVTTGYIFDPEEDEEFQREWRVLGGSHVVPDDDIPF